MAAIAMTGNALDEVARARLVHLIGVERAEMLWPTDPPRRLDPVPGLTLDDLDLGAAAQAYGDVGYRRIEGSNNWVVSGARTASGKPLLANDPHRTIGLPSLRYLTHLIGPGWNVIGAGEPALPGVAAGHNERVGFGFTIVGMDQQDVYVEQVALCEDGSGRCYRTRGAWLPVRVVVDTIRVKGEAPRVVRLEFTQHGPIVAEDTARGRAFVVRFVGSEPGTAGYLAQLAVDRARDWPGFLPAAGRRSMADRPEIQALAAWNYLMSRDQASPLLYEAWLGALQTRLERARAGAAAGVVRLELPTVVRWLLTPDSTLGPKPEAARDSLALAAWDDALREISTRLGPDRAAWSWGALHRAGFRHPLAAAFDLPSVPRGGDAHTVNATGGPDYRQAYGASYREILDLADWDRSVATSVPGQSGQPASPYYGDLLPLWAEGRYFPLAYSRARVERETAHILTLLPRPTSQ